MFTAAQAPGPPARLPAALRELLDLIRSHAARQPDGSWVSFRTNSDLVAATGKAAGTITRQLSELESRGLIRRHNKRIELVGAGRPDLTAGDTDAGGTPAGSSNDTSPADRLAVPTAARPGEMAAVTAAICGLVELLRRGDGHDDLYRRALTHLISVHDTGVVISATSPTADVAPSATHIAEIAQSATRARPDDVSVQTAGSEPCLTELPTERDSSRDMRDVRARRDRRQLDELCRELIERDRAAGNHQAGVNEHCVSYFDWLTDDQIAAGVNWTVQLLETGVITSGVGYLVAAARDHKQDVFHIGAGQLTPAAATTPAADGDVGRPDSPPAEADADEMDPAKVDVEELDADEAALAEFSRQPPAVIAEFEQRALASASDVLGRHLRNTPAMLRGMAAQQWVEEAAQATIEATAAK